MTATRMTLLQDLRDGDSIAWLEADTLYRPMIRAWLARFPLQASDVDDITQDVMSALIRKLPSFEHNGRVGAFRNWLRTTTVFAMRNATRKRKQLGNAFLGSFDQTLAELDDPNSHLSREFDREHTRWLVQRLLERIKPEFQAQTIAIFERHVVEGATVSETASALGVTEASVHTAKSRVLRRLRSYGDDLLELA